MVRQTGALNPLAFGEIAKAATECLRKSHYKVLSRVSCEYCHGVLYLRGRLFSIRCWASTATPCAWASKPRSKCPFDVRKCKPGTTASGSSACTRLKQSWASRVRAARGYRDSGALREAVQRTIDGTKKFIVRAQCTIPRRLRSTAPYTGVRIRPFHAT